MAPSAAEMSPSSALTENQTLSDLLNELSVIDQSTMPSDPDSIEKLMLQLDRAHNVANAIESRVDHLLEKIQTLLPGETSP